jgi:hypothetical protein
MIRDLVSRVWKVGCRISVFARCRIGYWPHHSARPSVVLEGVGGEAAACQRRRLLLAELVQPRGRV